MTPVRCKQISRHGSLEKNVEIEVEIVYAGKVIKNKRGEDDTDGTVM